MTLNLSSDDMTQVWQRAKAFISGEDPLSESGAIFRMANLVDKIATGKAVVMELDDKSRPQWEKVKERYGVGYTDSGILSNLVRLAEREYSEGRTTRMQTERIEQKTDIEIWLLFELLDKVLDNGTVESLKQKMLSRLEKK